METTSHFIWIELKSELFSDLFVGLYKYLKINKIEDIVSFQNSLSMHITLYYLEKELSDNDKNNIKLEIKKIDLSQEIFINWFDYFFRWKWNKYILYFNSKSNLNLKLFNENFHKVFNRNFIEDNKFIFIPHITFFKIKKLELFEKHRENIEKIINIELEKIKNFNLSNSKAFLYAVNSEYKEEIQVKI